MLNTILMTVYERTSEIGMLKAMGASAGNVFRLIWLETFFTCLVGGLVGVVLAIGSSRLLVLVLARVLPHVPADFSLGFAWDTVGLCMAVAAGLGLIAGTYPAFRSSAVSPIEAIRGGS